MGKNNKPIIIGAAVLGALAIGLTLMMLLGRVGGGGPAQPAPGDAPPVAPTTTRLVAARDIPPRTVITPDMVQEEETTTPDPAALKNASELQAGRITTRPIRRGEAITGGAMINSIARVVPANFAVPSGLRAVAIWVDPNQTAAGLVDVGDRVDIIANHKQTFEKQNTERYEEVFTGSKEGVFGRTIAQDLEVLAVDKSIQAAAVAPVATPAPGGAPGAAPPPPPPPPPPAAQAVRTRVVLAATPELAARLVAANELGILHITIRNPNSRERFPVPAAREFPGSVVRVPKRNPGGGQTGGAQTGGAQGRRDRGDIDDLRNPMGPPRIVEAPPIVGPMPTIPADTGNMTPTPSPGSEVTVIRGTEKTRVLVPSR